MFRSAGSETLLRTFTSSSTSFMAHCARECSAYLCHRTFYGVKLAELFIKFTHSFELHVRKYNGLLPHNARKVKMCGRVNRTIDCALEAIKGNEKDNYPLSGRLRIWFD